MNTKWIHLKEQGEQICYFFLFILLLTGLFHIAYITPIHSDDYLYGCVWTEYVRVSSWSDLWRSQLSQYESLNGRILANSLIQIILQFHRAVYACLNTALFVLCVYGICRISRQVNMFSLLLVALVLERILPYSAWTAGSVSYLWMSSLILAFLISAFSDNKKAGIVALLLALPAGNSHEALSAGAVAAMFFYALMNRHLLKDWRYILTFILLFLGFCSNALAPATFVRMSDMRIDLPYESMAAGFLVRLQLLGFSFATMAKGHLHIIALSLLAGGLCLRQHRTKLTSPLSVAFVGAGIITALLAFAANAVYPAAFYGMCLYFLLAIAMILLPQFSLTSYCSKGKLFLVLRLVLITVLFCSYVRSYHLNTIAADTKNRIECYVAEQARSGAKNIELPEQWCSGPGTSYFGNFSDCTHNRYAAAYHGVAPYAVFKNPEEIAILHDSANFDGLAPKCRRDLAQNRILYALAAKPEKVRCVFSPGEGYRRPGKQGQWLSKDAQRIPGNIEPSVFELEGKYYTMIQRPEGPGTIALTIRYEDGTVDTEQFTTPSEGDTQTE